VSIEAPQTKEDAEAQPPDACTTSFPGAADYIPMCPSAFSMVFRSPERS